LKTNDKHAIILALVATFLWSTVASAFKIGLKYLTPTMFLCYVIITAWFALTLINIFSSKTVPHINRRQLLTALTGGFLNPFLYYLILFVAYNRLPAQIAQSLNYTWPIVLVILSTIFLAQPLKPLSIAGMLISLTGVVAISYGSLHSDMHTDVWGIALAIGSSLIWATYWILNKKSTLDPKIQIWINFSMGLILILPFAIATEDFTLPPIEAIIPIIYSGLFEMAITFVVWLKALQKASSSSKISHYIYFSPFLSLIFINLILRESILISTIWGLSLIIAGIIWVEYGNKSNKVRQKIDSLQIKRKSISQKDNI